MFFSKLRIFFGYSFDVELSDLSIYEVYDAQRRKLKKLERVEGMCTEKNTHLVPFNFFLLLARIDDQEQKAENP